MMDDYSKRSRWFHYEQAEQEEPANPFGIEIVRYRRKDVYGEEDICFHNEFVLLGDAGAPFIHLIREDMRPDDMISLRELLR
jgi:hypothetical protein